MLDKQTDIDLDAYVKARNDLAAAKGCLLGAIISLCLWIVLILIITQI